MGPLPALPTPWFVGRERELAALRDAVGATAAGAGRVVLLAGEAGIGKTRTLEEAGAQARAAGFRALWGHCYEGSGAPAFWPWLQALRGLDGEHPTDLGELLARRQGITALPGSADPDAARFRLFEG